MILPTEKRGALGTTAMYSTVKATNGSSDSLVITSDSTAKACTNTINGAMARENLTCNDSNSDENTSSHTICGVTCSL